MLMLVTVFLVAKTTALQVLPVMLQVFISFSEHLSLTTTILKTVRYLAVCEHAILAALEVNVHFFP